jgi:hypothetical protein
MERIGLARVSPRRPALSLVVGRYFCLRKWALASGRASGEGLAQVGTVPTTDSWAPMNLAPPVSDLQVGTPGAQKNTVQRSKKTTTNRRLRSSQDSDPTALDG